jgi:aminoglycoside phosphotransferase (APT) family kinase protein
MSDSVELQGSVDELAARRLGAQAPVRALRALTAGANKATWSFEALVEDQWRGFVLQRAAEAAALEPDAEDDWLPMLVGAQEFAAMIAAGEAGVPVPRVHALLGADDPIGPGAITAQVEGETLGPRIVRDAAFAAARSALTGQCARALAAVHAIAPARMPFLGRLGADETLALYQRVLDGVGRPLPVIELALRWGREHRPAGSRLAVVHGDFRTGNFIVGPEGLRAVLDWEVAHLGDPMEDLGYLCMRTWRFGGAGPVGGFGPRAELLSAYQEASGQAVDPQAVRFWEVMGSVRWALGCVRRARSFRHQTRRRLEFAAVGRRLAEPAWDILDLIEGHED